MIYKVRKGEHNFTPNRYRLHAGITSGIWEVEFNETNLYNYLQWGDGWNKLFGWSYRLLPFYDSKIYGRKWCAPHHKHSLRVAWRAVPYERKIELCLYVYEYEVRRESATFYVPINSRIRLQPEYSKNFFRLQATWGLETKPIHRDLSIPFTFPATWGYMLNPEFIDSGSPQDMFLHLTRIK